MSGAIPPLPNTPLWCGAQLQTEEKLYGHNKTDHDYTFISQVSALCVSYLQDDDDDSSNNSNNNNNNNNNNNRIAH
jgi:hypothetical protein